MEAVRAHHSVSRKLPDTPAFGPPIYSGSNAVLPFRAG